jgi:uncharacterized protein YxeA
MKKIMSIMLGMSLVLGAASFAFAQDKPADDKSKAKDKKAKKKKGEKKTDDKSKS